MTIVIELPAELEEELSIEAGRKGVTPEQQAEFFLQLATAIRRESTETPLRSVLSRHRIDPLQLAMAFEDLNKIYIEDQSSISLESSVSRESTIHAKQQTPQSFLGKYAHIKLSTEDIIAEKRRESEREDRPR